MQKQLCKIIATPCTVRSACEATNVSETAFYSWIRRGEEGERPFAQFAQAVAGARGKGKIKVQRDIWGCNDPRVKLELLARIYPEEFGRTAERPLPPQPLQPVPDLSKSIRVSCYATPDVDLAQFMEMKAKLEAAGVKTDFPIMDTAPAFQVATNDDDDDVGNDLPEADKLP